MGAMAATGANAQGLEWGVKSGANLSWHTEVFATAGLSGSIEQKMRTGFYAGMFAEKVFSRRFGLQAELLYSQTGTKFEVGEHSFAIKTDYIVLPVLAKLYVFRGFSVDLGPQLNCLVVAGHRQSESAIRAAGGRYFGSGRSFLQVRRRFRRFGARQLRFVEIGRKRRRLESRRLARIGLPLLIRLSPSSAPTHGAATDARPLFRRFRFMLSFR